MKHPRTAALARAARAKTGLTQKAFAETIWTGVRTIANWESGEKPPVGPIELLLTEIANGFVPTAKRDG